MTKTELPFTQSEKNIIDEALSILELRLSNASLGVTAFNEYSAVVNYLKLKMAGLEHEVFAVLFLDNQNHLIAYEEMFRGTLNRSAIYIREVAKRALQLNAGAVIFAHNHPSGITEPSQSDISITNQLIKALSIFDVTVLDHIIVGHPNFNRISGATSFANRGLI